MKKIIEKFYRKFIFPALKEIARPKDIPFISPDYGWNHGESKSDVERTVGNEHGHNT
jgi:hypothetical protein